MKINKRGANLHPGDYVRVVASPARLRSVNLHTHSCSSDRVEEVRPHADPRGETDVKITCGYVVPISMLRFESCPHVVPVPVVHAFTKGRIACGIAIMPGTRFALSPDRWTCGNCNRKMRRPR